MWANFVACLDAVLPIFGLILLGYAAKCMGLLDRGDVRKMNKVFFRFFLPVMLFYSLYSSDLSHAVQPGLIAYALGCTRLLKFFPASVAGGLAGLRTLAAPYKHLGIRFLPLGGLKRDNTAEWLADPLVAACGGSWIAPAKLIAAGDWAAIADNARAASAAAASARPVR